MNFYIMVFNNTHEAMAGESIMEKENVNVMVMPTPTYITNSCGISLRFSEDMINDVEKVIEEKDLKFKNIYFRNEQGFKVYK